MTWSPATDDVGVERYEVLRASSANGPRTVIARPFGTRFVDDTADPANGPWFYRVRAVDGGGNIGPASNVAVATAGRVVHYECEALLPATTSPGDQAGQLDLVLFPQFGRVWSADNTVLFVADRYGDWIEFDVPITVAGNYALRLAYATFTGRPRSGSRWTVRRSVRRCTIRSTSAAAS